MLGAFGIVIGLFLFFIPGIYVLIRWHFRVPLHHRKIRPGHCPQKQLGRQLRLFWPLLNGLAVLFVILLGGNLLIEMLLQMMGIESMMIRRLLDIVFGFLNCLYTIYGYRLYCVMREGGPAEQE